MKEKKKKGGLSCKRVSTTKNGEQLLRCSFSRKKKWGNLKESERRITKVLKREERRTPRYAFFRFSYRKHVMIWTHVYTKINKPFLFCFFFPTEKNISNRMLNFNRQFFFWVARNLIIFYSPFLGNDETRRKEVETS